MRSSWMPALFWFSVATLVRFGALLLVRAYSFGAGFEGFYPLESAHDDRFYFKKAVEIAEGYQAQVLPNAYPLILGYIFRWFGVDLFLGQTVNVFLGGLSVMLGVLLAENLRPWRGHPWALKRPGHLAGFLLTFYPSSVFYSTQLLKDPLVLFLGTWLLYVLVILYQRPRFFNVLLASFLSGFLLLFRPYAAITLWLALGGFLFLQKKNVHLLLIGVGLAGFVPWAFGLGPFAFDYLVPLVDLARLSQLRREVYGIGNSSLGIALDPGNPIASLLAWLYSTATVLLGPFPWQAKSSLIVLAMGEAMVVWLLIWKAKLSPKRLLRPSVEDLPLITSLILSGVIGLFSDNIGANTRLRLLVWSFLLVYMAVRIGNRNAPSLPHHPR